jgi:dihydroorotase
MQKYLFKNIQIVNEGKITASDVLINNQYIEKIAPVINTKQNVVEIDGNQKYLLPGIIDNHVHFREPGFAAKRKHLQ